MPGKEAPNVRTNRESTVNITQLATSMSRKIPNILSDYQFNPPQRTTLPDIKCAWQVR